MRCHKLTALQATKQSHSNNRYRDCFKLRSLNIFHKHNRAASRICNHRRQYAKSLSYNSFLCCPCVKIMCVDHKRNTAKYGEIVTSLEASHNFKFHLYQIKNKCLCSVALVLYIDFFPYKKTEHNVHSFKTHGTKTAVLSKERCQT